MSVILHLNLHREFFAQIAAGTKWIEDRTLELPGANPVKDAHAALDTAPSLPPTASAPKRICSPNSSP